MLLPLIVPYIQGEGIEMTPAFLSALAGSALAGCTAVYCGVKNRGFGMRMQAMTIGFIILGMSSNTFRGLIAEKYPRVVPVMQWALMLLGLIIGIVLGQITMRFETAVTILATSLLGAYSALLIVASMGFEFTEGLTISDIANGTTGCTIWSCHTALVATMLFALIGIINQRTFKDPDALEMLEEPGCYKRWLKRVWLFAKTFCEPIFTLNDTLIELGRDGVTPAEEEVAMQTFYTSLKKLISFIGNCTVLVCSGSLFISTIELFIVGIYSRTASMTYLGLCILGISLYLFSRQSWACSRSYCPTKHLGSASGVYPYPTLPCLSLKRCRVTTRACCGGVRLADVMSRRTKIFLLLGFLIIPVAVCAALLCYTLADTSFGDVPWVTDFIGISAERISAKTGITLDSLADGNATDATGVSLMFSRRLL